MLHVESCWGARVDFEIVAGLVQRKTQQMRLSKHRRTSHHLTLRTSPPEMTNQFRFAKYYDWWTDTVIWVNPNRCFYLLFIWCTTFHAKKIKGLSLTASQSVGQEMSQRPPHLPIKADFINFLLQQVWEAAALPTSRAKWLTRIPRIEGEGRLKNPFRIVFDEGIQNNPHYW